MIKKGLPIEAPSWWGSVFEIQGSKMIFAWKPTLIPIENESHLRITPREEGWIGVFATIREVSYKWLQFPCFSPMNWFSFSILWTNNHITNNNGFTNTPPNKLLNPSHMQMKQRSPNMIYKTLHQRKHSFQMPLDINQQKWNISCSHEAPIVKFQLMLQLNNLHNSMKNIMN